MDIRYKLKNFTYFLVKVRMAARESAVEFWKLYASDCLQIRSIKEVYLKYTDYCKQTERPALNEYATKTQYKVQKSFIILYYK